MCPGWPRGKNQCDPQADASKVFFLSFFLSFFFLSFWAALTAHGGSQARGPIRATATPQPQQPRILNPLSEDRDQTRVLRDASWVLQPLSHNGNPEALLNKGDVLALPLPLTSLLVFEFSPYTFHPLLLGKGQSTLNPRDETSAGPIRHVCFHLDVSLVSLEPVFRDTDLSVSETTQL